MGATYKGAAVWENAMRYLLGLVLALSACNNNNGDDTQQGPDAANTTPVTPKVGAWNYDEVTPVSRTCDSRINQGGTGGFGIDQSSTSSFHVLPNDGTAAFTCTLNGSAFNCPDRAAGTQDLRPAFDATLTLRAIATGTFSSSTQASGRQEATVTCAGAACAATGITFPCNIKVDFVIRAH